MKITIDEFKEFTERAYRHSHEAVPDIAKLRDVAFEMQLVDGFSLHKKEYDIVEGRFTSVCRPTHPYVAELLTYEESYPEEASAATALAVLAEKYSIPQEDAQVLIVTCLFEFQKMKKK